MAVASRSARAPLGGALGVSALFHAAVVALVLWTSRSQPPMKLPPVYRVNIVAAPAGPRAIGVVNPEPQPVAKPTTEPPKMREVPTPQPAAPVKHAPAPPARATPTTAKTLAAPTKAPRAGGGPTGGKGTDVATVQTNGVEFPYPGYLNNIVRQIALNFHPSNPNAPLSATMSFLIHRDGTVSDVRFVTRSGVYAFDLEAQGAIERAARAFGPLPDGFRDDVLPVVFSFDPKFLQ